MAKDREEARKRKQEEEDRHAAEEQKLWATQEADPAAPKLFNPAEKEATEDQAMETSKPKVFVIHGHDALALKNTEVLLHRIGCRPFTFSTIPDKATKTNIEILERYLPSCDAVVVLMTPDDEGRKRGTAALEPRARQNVLIEAGFAIISRRASSLIVALGNVSIPSDFDGINRIQASAWDGSTDLYVARELSNMLGLSFDIRHF